MEFSQCICEKQGDFVRVLQFRFLDVLEIKSQPALLVYALMERGRRDFRHDSGKWIIV